MAWVPPWHGALYPRSEVVAPFGIVLLTQNTLSGIQALLLPLVWEVL